MGAAQKKRLMSVKDRFNKFYSVNIYFDKNSKKQMIHVESKN